ncbi:MAG: acyl-CoA reductase [bacterium]
MSSRLVTARGWVTRLLSSEAIAAVVADGWPEPMVHAGFRLHEHTWNVDAIIREIQRENVPVERLPRHVQHVWPALPGAGVTPLLYSYLVGVPRNTFRPSRRGTNFGTLAQEVGLERQDEIYADVVVASGSDDTIAALQKLNHARVVGYGHRVSIALASKLDAVGHAADVVMWHQQGCFSLRGIVFVGSDHDARTFCAALAEQIAEHENCWDARPGELGLGQRAQALGVAEFTSEVFLAHYGFVTLSAQPLDGAWRAPHAVQVVRVERAEQITSAVAIARHHVQGVSIDDERFRDVAWRLGATRVCRPGSLQAPEPEWQHDGLPNVGVLIE